MNKRCFQYSVSAVSIWLCAIALTPVAPAEAVGHKVNITVGHVIGGTETAMVAKLMSMVEEDVPEARIIMEATDRYCCTEDRFTIVEKSGLPDMVLLYAGQTAQLCEIQKLVADEQLFPIDNFVDIKKLNLEDVFSNLMQPVSFIEHIWAVPVRVCPPVLAVPESIHGDLDSWDDIIKHAPIIINPINERFLFWRTLAAQCAGLNIADGKIYANNSCIETSLQFVKSHTTIDESFNNNSAIRLAFADSMFNNFSNMKTCRFIPYPKANRNLVFCQENTWYIGISKDASQEKHQVLLSIIASLLGERIQMFIARAGFSPPVRPSLHASPAFNESFPIGTIQAAGAVTVSRMRFRQGTQWSRQVEGELEEVFRKSMEQNVPADLFLSSLESLKGKWGIVSNMR